MQRILAIGNSGICAVSITNFLGRSGMDRLFRRLMLIGLVCVELPACPCGWAAMAASTGSIGPPLVIQSFAISPSGASLAEIVRPLGDQSGANEILVRSLRDSRGGTRTIHSGRSISSLQWMSDRQIMFVSTGPRAQVVAEDVTSGRQTVLFQRAGGIASVLYDRQSGRFAYEYMKPWTWGARVSVRMTDGMTVTQLLEPSWAAPERTYVEARQIVSDGAQKTRPVALNFHTLSQSAHPSMLAWQGGRLLVLEQLSDWSRTRLSRIVDTGSGQAIDDWAPLFEMFGMAVSSSGRVAVTGMALPPDGIMPAFAEPGDPYVAVLGPRGQTHEISALLANQHVLALTGLWWAGRDRLFVQVDSEEGTTSDKVDGPQRWTLQEVDWRTNRILRIYRWPNGDLGGINSPCSMDVDRTEAICVAQTLITPPRLVEVDLRSGRMRDLGPLDPRQHALTFRFTDVLVPYASGRATTAFLALPADAPGKKVPLAVMLYGFSERYSPDAQWITSYPVAELVKSGIAVLLLNWPHHQRVAESIAKEDPFAEGKRALNDDVSIIANALPAVRAAGNQISRAMIMGWSFGGLFVSHAIQDLHEYVAAQVGDPASYNTTAYALDNESWRMLSRWTFGGPPTRKYIGNYLYFDPAADGRPANGPILLEFVSSNLTAGQFLQEWRGVGTYVEAFAYHRSFHWLNIPAEAQISRLRNLYWAKTNLFGPQSVTCAQLRSVGLTVPTSGWWSRESAATRGRGAVQGNSCRTR